MQKLTMPQGFSISESNPINEGTHIDYTMRSLGNINKDGFGDFALSRPDIGVNYIVLGHDGKSRPFTDMVFDKPSADWFKITSYANDTILTTLAGDVNDDGYDDIMLNSGSTVYVLFGKRDQLYDMNASDIKMPNGFKITTANARIMNLNAVGDVNGDKIDDFAITLMTPAPERSMSIYVIFGSKNSADIDLSNLSPKDGAHITGSPGGVAFNSLLISSVACDYNQDGYSDIIITHSTDTVAVVLGKSNFGDINIDHLAIPDGIIIKPQEYGNYILNSSGVCIEGSGNQYVGASTGGAVLDPHAFATGEISVWKFLSNEEL